MVSLSRSMAWSACASHAAGSRKRPRSRLESTKQSRETSMNVATSILPRPANPAATAALGAMLLAAPALAETPNPSQSALAADGNQIEEIIVTAQKRSQNIQDIPITVNAIDGATLKELGIKSSDEISEYISNLQSGLPPATGTKPIITIRGVGLNDFNTNNAGPNGVYVDEVYMSSPASQTFQTFDLDRVEVLKGPQGTLYGRNTTGGAVNYIAAKPTSTPSASLHTSYGSFDTYEADGVISGPIADGVNGRLAFVRNGSDGFMPNLRDGKRTNGANDLAYRGLLEAKPRDDLTFLFNFHGGWVHTLPTEYHHVGTLDATGAQCPNTEILAGNCVDLFGYQGPKNLYQGNYNRYQDLDIKTYGASIR